MSIDRSYKKETFFILEFLCYYFFKKVISAPEVDFSVILPLLHLGWIWRYFLISASVQRSRHTGWVRQPCTLKQTLLIKTLWVHPDGLASCVSLHGRIQFSETHSPIFLSHKWFHGEMSNLQNLTHDRSLMNDSDYWDFTSVRKR